MLRFHTILILACAPLFGQHYTISTVAGEGAGGVSFHFPTGIAADHLANIYVADWSGFVRRIWARGGAVTTVAGNGILGYGGDGGPATAARIGKGLSLATDGSGNLFIADTDNNRIRRVDFLSGIITTVAGTGASRDSGDGGPAVSAGVFMPTGIAVGPDGDLFFSSSWSNIRKLTVKTGIIDTIAGKATTAYGGDGGDATGALFWDPVPGGLNRDGDLYLADYENSRIRMIARSTGMVMTVAGAGSCAPGPLPLYAVTVCQGGFGGDGGPARAAVLHHAAAMAIDADGNLFIADTLNHRIRRVDASSGLIHTIAGTGVSGFSGDGGPAVAAEITFPAGIAVDASGKVYFSDENNNRVRVLTPASPTRP